MRLRNKNPKIMLIVTGIAFIISGIDCLENNMMLIAISSFIVGFINIVACLFMIRHPFFVKILLLIINAVFAFLSSYIYLKAGKDMIQYAWLAIGIISLIAIGFAYRKRAKEKLI